MNYTFQDMLDIIDRLGGLLYGLLVHRQFGKQIRVAHRRGPDGRTPSGHTGDEYADLLRRYKIDCWAKRTTNDHLIFRVRVGQWQWAVDLLARHGADVEHRPRGWARRSPVMPTPWADRPTRAGQRARRRR